MIDHPAFSSRVAMCQLLCPRLLYFLGFVSGRGKCMRNFMKLAISPPSQAKVSAIAVTPKDVLLMLSRDVNALSK